MYSTVFRACICKPFKDPRNRFSAWQAGTATLFVVLAHQATQAGGIGSSESIPGLLNVYKYGLGTYQHFIGLFL
jgi:hypothetical protein